MSIAIAISASAFAFVDIVFIRPLPYHFARRVVAITAHDTRRNIQVSLGYGTVQDISAQRGVFEKVAAITFDHATLSKGSSSTDLMEAVVSPDFLNLLGVDVAVGRALDANDSRSNAQPVAVLSHGTWESLFGGSTDAVGSSVLLNGRPTVLIGVLPASFRSPFLLEPDFLVPLSDATPSRRGMGPYIGLARLQKDAGIESARSAATVALNAPSQLLLGETPKYEPQVVPISTIYQRRYAGFALLALAGALLVFATASINVAGLALTRAGRFRSDAAIRNALGGNALNQCEPQLVEHALLGLFTLVLCVPLTSWLLAACRNAFTTETLPRLDDLRVDSSVVLFAVLACAILWGSVAGIVCLRMRAGGRGVPASICDAGSSGMLAGRVFIAAQVFIGTALLIAGSLLASSMYHALTSGATLDVANVATYRIAVSGHAHSDKNLKALYTRLLTQLTTISDIRSAALASSVPFDYFTPGEITLSVGTPGSSRAVEAKADWKAVSDDYFRTFGIPVLSGEVESLGAGRHSQEPGVAVDQLLVESLWPDRQAIGKQVTVALEGKTTTARVVATVGNARNDAREHLRPQIYFSLNDHPVDAFRLVVRGKSLASPSAREVRQTVVATDPEQIVSAAESITQLIRRETESARSLALLIGGCAVVAVLLAIIGIVSFTSQYVTGRKHELAVRAALGASDHALIYGVLRQAIPFLLAGAILGVACGAYGSSMLRAWLYDVSATDPAIYAAAFAIVVTGALASAYLPARAACNCDPAALLHDDA